MTSLPFDLVTEIAAIRTRYPLKGIRQQVGETMLQIARARDDFLVLTADLLNATGMAGFGAQYPHRVLNVGIAEQNLAGIASGLALCGKLPFVSCYGAFTTLRGIEQIKVDAAYNGVKVVFAAQSCGLSYGVGGPTHQTYEDVAIMRAIPNTMVLVPSDAREVDACLRSALDADFAGPIYVRLGRGPEYLFNDPGKAFEIGKATILRSAADVALIANGSMVVEALIAAEALEQLGISAGVLNVSTVKPFDRGTLRQFIEPTSRAIVIEEHSTVGGLGSAVLEAMAEAPSPPIRLMGIPDAFPPIGPTFELRASLGLDAAGIVAAAMEMGQLDRRTRAART